LKESIGRGWLFNLTSNFDLRSTIMTQIDHIQKLVSGQRGEFAASLAKAWQHADSENRRALEQAFPGILIPRATVYSHQYGIAFSITTMHAADEVTKDELLAGLRLRYTELTINQAIVEACGAPADTYIVE